MYYFNNGEYQFYYVFRSFYTFLKLRTNNLKLLQGNHQVYPQKKSKHLIFFFNEKLAINFVLVQNDALFTYKKQYIYIYKSITFEGLPELLQT